MKRLPWRKFTPDEHETWNLMFRRQVEKRDEQIHPLFSQGIGLLGLRDGGVPEIEEVNKRLRALTGFEGVPVEGLEEDYSFYHMLAEGLFPIGNFIRDRKDVSYTPAPDVFHDLYGHLPFLADRDYADFCRELGKRAVAYPRLPGALTQFARLFWFAIEFSVIRTPAGRRIFGAGIASSHGECAYALSDKPTVIPFSVESVRRQDFRVDRFQDRIFEIGSLAELYGCLPEFERAVLTDPEARDTIPVA